jgi:hypothetical protein
MDLVQRKRGRQILWAVADFAAANGYTKREARRAARLAIMCAMDESSLRVLANRNVAGSAELPHDGFGSDHASVGLFQQQVPGWGTAAQCMDVKHSTEHFLRALRDKGELPPFRGRPLWERVQAVQVSATPDGSNYRRYAGSSWRFILRYWNLAAGRPYGARV